jgi:hypothetical protein
LNKYTPGQDINIFAEEICASQLDRLYIQAERTVIVPDKLTTYIPDAVEIKETDWKSLLTTVRGAWLNNLYEKYKTDLFSANLRVYLGSRESDSNINNGIKTTAEEEPKNFYVYNNGITALVLDYELGRRTRKGRKLEISGISIVNGAQTTGSLANLSGSVSPELQVQIRFVKANKDAIIGNVVRFNNSQNRLQAADFRSTDPIQERLKDAASLTQIEKTSLAFLNKKGANYLLVHVISQCMETIIGKSVPNRFDLHFATNISPNKAAEYWSPIVEMMLALTNQLDVAFSRNRISNETVSKTVLNFVGVVASLASLHKRTFEEFASVTKLGY